VVFEILTAEYFVFKYFKYDFAFKNIWKIMHLKYFFQNTF